MELQPKRPPGRIDRKAARYAAEIARLRRAGYTFEAIREALADIGLEVSSSALEREMRRLRQRSPSAPLPEPFTPPTPMPSVTPPVAPSPSSHPPSAVHPLPSASTPQPRGSPSSSSSPPNEVKPSTRVVEHSRASAEAFFAANPSRLLHPNKEIP